VGEELTVYVELLNEGVHVWRPVEAVPHASPNVYRLTGDPPDEEEWAFQPGTLVRCEYRDLSEGPALVATEAVAET
jgi:hypothetical protein